MVERVRRSLTIYRHLAVARVRSDLQYRIGFGVFLLAQTLITFLDFLTIWFVFGQTPALDGWTVVQVAFLYGISSLAFGMADLLVGSVETISSHVRTGNLDRFMVRPVGVLIQLLGEGFVLRRLGRIAQAALILGVAMSRLQFDWSPLNIILLILTLVSGTVIAGSIWVITNVPTFWLINSGEAANSFTYGGNFLASYPISIFDRWLRVLLAYVFPMAFVAYFPSLALIDAPDPLGAPVALRYLAPLVAVIVALAARAIWQFSIRHYQSTGS